MFEKIESENTVLKESLNRVMKERNEGTTKVRYIKILIPNVIFDLNSHFYKSKLMRKQRIFIKM